MWLLYSEIENSFYKSKLWEWGKTILADILEKCIFLKFCNVKFGVKNSHTDVLFHTQVVLLHASKHTVISLAHKFVILSIYYILKYLYRSNFYPWWAFTKEFERSHTYMQIESDPSAPPHLHQISLIQVAILFKRIFPSAPLSTSHPSPKQQFPLGQVSHPANALCISLFLAVFLASSLLLKAASLSLKKFELFA